MGANGAAGVVEALRRLGSDVELAKVRTRVADDEEAFGVRMGSLFEVARANTDVTLDDVEALLDHPAYEPRMAAFCILDFKARRRLGDDERRTLCELYLRRHDRVSTWDMVDRAAPRVVGGYLAGRSKQPLHALAASAAPLERRTAITAPLYFVRAGSEDDVTDGFGIAAALAADPVPHVHKAVGIFLKHAGARDARPLRRFLDEHAPAMARPALRLAVEKLDRRERAAYLAS